MKLTPRSVLDELAYPEYKSRHIFTAKLRLVIFVGFWFLYFFYLRDYLVETKSVTITIIACFLVTTVCYYNIFSNRLATFSFALEILSDLVAMTAIIYLTGGPESEYYVIYIFYAVAAGLFYNYRLALLIGVLSFFCYGLFVALCYMRIIPPLFIGIGGYAAVRVQSPYFHPFLLAVFLGLAVYATKIAHYFTQLRERMLEARNKELLALQQMSSTIRSLSPIDNVLGQVLHGVLDGLNLTICLLLLYEKENRIIKCIPPDDHPLVEDIEDHLGIRLRDLHLPADAVYENAAIKSLSDGKIIFRRSIGELTTGIRPEIPAEKFDTLQELLGVKRVVAIPLVTGREVVGALVGFTKEAFVEARMVHTFQAFADQAALAIETAILITELKKKNIALLEANRVKSEFLATMSHELRTPLTAIIGFSELLLEGVMGELTEGQKDSQREILNNGADLLDMINNLLDLAKVDSGKMKLLPHLFDWGEMINRLGRSITPLVKRKNLNLVIDIPTSIPPVVADERRMQQVVLNLLSNAIKFTPEQGKITIGSKFVKNYDDFSKEYSCNQEAKVDKTDFLNGILVNFIEDTGIGIDPEHIPTIFDMFQQVESSMTRRYRGTGLGLSLVKQFVELHKGFIWVESRKGTGTRFTFALPVKP